MFPIGIDYGTNSVRVLAVRCKDGAEIGNAIFDYPSGHQGVRLDPKDHNLARQNPARLSQVTKELLSIKNASNLQNPG